MFDEEGMMETFAQRCYALLRRVPEGRVTTYKAIAEALGSKAYRAVGNAMRANPHPVDVPCHRVVKSDGTLGGYVSGADEKAALLESEGVAVKEGKVVDFEKLLYRFQ
jgi:methylated-DNA-[protein]-cysteine S-methyltransferase